MPASYLAAAPPPAAAPGPAPPSTDGLPEPLARVGREDGDRGRRGDGKRDGNVKAAIADFEPPVPGGPSPPRPALARGTFPPGPRPDVSPPRGGGGSLPRGATVRTFDFLSRKDSFKFRLSLTVRVP